jgi:hypothetical protein
VTAHRFQVGQKVKLRPARPDADETEGEFVVAELFRHQGEPFYCVKSPDEPYERVLPESRLRAVASERRGRSADVELSVARHPQEELVSLDRPRGVRGRQ